MAKIILLPLVAFTVSSCRFQNVLTLFSSDSNEENALNQLTTPKVEKITTEYYAKMSPKTFDSYMAFATKFSSLCINVTRQDGYKESLGVSIPDAYLCFAIEGIISNDAARNDVLSYLELDSVEELRIATKEIIQCLCTLHKNNEGKLTGGYNLNSVWLNPEKVSLIQEKDEQLYKDLEEIFDVSTYLEALTTAKAKKYINDYGLENMPVPDIELDDDNPPAVGTMSVYYCLDYFPQEDKLRYKEEFTKGNHKMDYQVDDKVDQVDYIYSQGLRNVYEGDNFYGSSLPINRLNMMFFLPKDSNALPNSILDDVLNGNYELKHGIMTYKGEEKDTTIFDVSVSAPYFSLENDIYLGHNVLSSILPIITYGGAAERLVQTKSGLTLVLSFLRQFSIMKFNYDGFYSCSVTIMGATEGMPEEEPVYEHFDLKLNHPYIFEVTKFVSTDSSYNYKRLPIVVGEIINPNYKD